MIVNTDYHQAPNTIGLVQKGKKKHELQLVQQGKKNMNYNKSHQNNINTIVKTITSYNTQYE